MGDPSQPLVHSSFLNLIMLPQMQYLEAYCEANNFSTNGAEWISGMEDYMSPLMVEEVSARITGVCARCRGGGFFTGVCSQLFADEQVRIKYYMETGTMLPENAVGAIVTGSYLDVGNKRVERRRGWSLVGRERKNLRFRVRYLSRQNVVIKMRKWPSGWSKDKYNCVFGQYKRLFKV